MLTCLRSAEEQSSSLGTANRAPQKLKHVRALTAMRSGSIAVVVQATWVFLAPNHMASCCVGVYTCDVNDVNDLHTLTSSAPFSD